MGSQVDIETRAHREQLLRRVETTTNPPLMILALLLIPILLAPYVVDLSPATQSWLTDLGLLIWGVFAAVFLVELFIAPDKRSFLRTHWFDALLVALPMLRPLRILRLVRLVIVAAAFSRALAVSREISRRRGLQFIGLAGLMVILVFGTIATSVERGEPEATIQSLPDGLWWAVVTATTVGYGDTYPQTAIGKGVGVALMLIGIALFGALTANLAAFFVERSESDMTGELAAEIRQLREEIRLLRQQHTDQDQQRVEQE